MIAQGVKLRLATGYQISIYGLHSVQQSTVANVGIPFILDVTFMDVSTGVTQEEGHTGFLNLPSAVLALVFLAKQGFSRFVLVFYIIGHSMKTSMEASVELHEPPWRPSRTSMEASMEPPWSLHGPPWRFPRSLHGGPWRLHEVSMEAHGGLHGVYILCFKYHQ